MENKSAPVTQHLDVIRFQGSSLHTAEDIVANEVRVALVYNGVSHTVMMASPQDLEAFAIGFTLSERIVEQLAEIKDIEIQTVANGVLIYMEITQRRFIALKEQRRSMAGRTGCGLCGVAQLEHAMKPVIQVADSQLFALADLTNVLDTIADYQPVFGDTGATHAAMALAADGSFISAFEDVGRHIALDKLIGACAKEAIRPAAVLLTSRASFEMVQKAASAGIEILFAISAATALAVELAQQSNITLVGFCRHGRATVYSHPQRIETACQNNIVNFPHSDTELAVAN